MQGRSAEREGLPWERLSRKWGGFNAKPASRPLMPRPSRMLGASSASCPVASSPAARVALAEREGLPWERLSRRGRLQHHCPLRGLCPLQQSRCFEQARQQACRSGRPLRGRRWRRGRDSNPRCPCGQSGFQDRRIRPLCHLSEMIPANGPRRYPSADKEKAPLDRGFPSGAKEIRTLDLRIANAAL